MLVGNGARLHASNPMLQLAAPLVGSVERAAWHQAGPRRNFWAGNATVVGGSSIANKYGFPSGVRHPLSWCMSPKAGGMSARYELGITTSNTGAGALGRNLEGSIAVTLTNANASLQLIVNGSGAISVAVTNSGNLRGALYASGTSAVTVTNANATLGALAGLFGATTITVTPSATPQAKGWMIGAITPYTELSPESLATAVWSKSAAEANAVGTMGEKLNDAGSGANPWTEVIESGYTAAEVLRIITAFAVGDATGLEGSSPVFKSLDGLKNRITATYSGGTRTVTDLDGT